MQNSFVLITGVTSGIGKGLAEESAKLGYNLFLVARKSAELDQVADACQKMNPQIQIRKLVADVTQKNLTEVLESEMESVDNLRFAIVNAGIGCTGRFEKLRMQDFERVWDVNVNGALRTIYGCLKSLKKSKGRLILLGSLNSYLSLPLGAPYNMSKFAIRTLGETLDAELSSDGIGVSVVYPGPVRSNIVATNNKGQLVPEAQEFFARQPAQDANVAARKILNGALRGKRGFSLTISASVILFLQQRFPQAFAFLIRTGYHVYRDKILNILGRVNPDQI